MCPPTPRIAAPAPPPPPPPPSEAVKPMASPFADARPAGLASLRIKPASPRQSITIPSPAPGPKV